jgi:uncharacterized protein
VLMVGHVVEGTTGERVHRAGVKFKTMFELYEKKAQIHAVKDASRGGWFGNLCEMLVKSETGIKITSIPYPSPTRYMGTFLVCVPASEADNVVTTAARHGAPCVEVGTIMKGLDIKVGSETWVSAAKMKKLVRGLPYRRPRSV